MYLIKNGVKLSSIKTNNNIIILESGKLLEYGRYTFQLMDELGRVKIGKNVLFNGSIGNGLYKLIHSDNTVSIVDSKGNEFLVRTYATWGVVDITK